MLPVLWPTVIADDHPMVRAAIRQAVTETGLCEVAGEAGDGAAAVRLALDLPPGGLVLMDLAMPVLDGCEATARILHTRPDLRIIAISMYADQLSLSAMIFAGACSYIPKTESAGALRHVIAEVMAGRASFPPGASAVLREMIRHPDNFGGVRMTRREFECLRLAAEGMSVKETATRMRVEESTVRGYRKSLGRKTGRPGARALRQFFLETMQRAPD